MTTEFSWSPFIPWVQTERRLCSQRLFWNTYERLACFIFSWL